MPERNGPGVAWPDAVLFDLDGTLLDSEALSLTRWESVLSDNGISLPKGTLETLVGVDRRGTVVKLSPYVGGADQADHLTEQFYRRQAAEIAPGVIPLKPDAEAALKWVEARSIPFALVTSSSDAEVSWKVPVDWVARFGAVVTADDVAQRKPNPEPYLKGAAHLGVSAERCVAFEDSLSGAISAFRAGARLAVVVDLHAPVLPDDVVPVVTGPSLTAVWPAMFGEPLPPV